MVNEIPHASRVRAPIGNSDEAQQSVGICLSVAVAVCALLGAASQPAGAEDALEELVVTGTRIAAPNLKSTSPVVAISSTDLKLGGHTDISDVLNLLPQISSNSLGQDLGNRTSGLTAAGGVATADLRGLGPNRTLVLVDGRRLGAGSPNTAIQSPAPDLDQIPSALIERVEVVTGGASAVYGSDAIAGVVNFIMKKNFEGLQLDYQIGANQHSNHSTFSQNVQRDAGYTPLTGSTWDGQNTTASVIAGANILDGAGNVTAYFNYLKANPVRSGQRDFGGCQLNANSTLTGATCSGSGNSNYFEPTDSTINPQGNAYSVKGSQFVDWGTAGTQPPTLFNTQPYIYMAREDVRYNAGFLAHVDVNEHVKPYLEFGFMNDRTHQEIAPTALYEDANPLDPISGNYNINCSNPLLSAQQASLLCTPAQIAADAATPGSVSANVRIGRRNVEGGGRSSDFEHTNYRVVGGAKGEILKGWTYDAYAQYYYTSFFTSNNQYLSFQAIDNALQVKGTAANPVCISGGSCVPYNIFSDNGVTQAALAPMYLSGTAFGSNTLRTIHADVTGDLGKYGLQSPLASGGVGVNFGYEHRAEHVKFQPDSGELSGLLSGFGGASVPINNGYKVDEEFIELRAPLVQDRPGVKDLVFDTGYRHSQYSTAGGVSTYKFEVQYAPVDDLRLRGSFNRATRVPSIIELYNPQLVGQISYGTDPCSPTTDVNNQPVAAAATLAQCQRTGGHGGTVRQRS